MGKSNHKNFVEWLWRKRSKIIKDLIIPYQDRIFNSFSSKFELDAKADWNRWRKKLEELWFKCAENCKQIHEILTLDSLQSSSKDITSTVNNIINMDYWSVEKFFERLRNKYKNHPQVYRLLDDTKNNLWEMRRISKKHTNIIKN
jgi:hypothetical protein